MNQKDYLMALYDALEGLPAQLRADTISEYKDYFRTEAEKGRAENDIIASLGDPVELAKVIKNRTAYAPPPPPPPRPNIRRRRSMGFVGWIIVALIFSGGFSAIGSAAKAFGNGFFNGMPIVLGTRYDVNDTEQVNLGTAKRIEIRTISTNTNVLKSGTNEVKASLTGHVTTTNKKAVPYLEMSHSGDTIIIEQKREESLIIGMYSSNVKFDIRIPESFKGDITFKGSSGNLNASDFEFKSFHAELTSGDVVLRNLLLKEEFYLSSTSGNLTLEGLTASNAVLKSTSGDKRLSNLEVNGNVEIVSHSGNTKIADISCNKITVECTSGDITVDGCKTDLIYLTSQSGNVTVRDLEGAARVGATSGNIEVNASAPRGEYNLEAHSGNVKLLLPSGTGFELYAKVSSGNINCGFHLDNRSEEKRSLRGTAGSGEIPVTISTTSGNINLVKR